jgi:hypothetical protein
MAPSAIPVERPEHKFVPKVCKSHHVRPAEVDQTLAAVEQHINNLAKEASTILDASYSITERPIGTRRPIRVACMGAGYSGLMMAILFSQKMQDKNAEFVIYERNEDLGGTWLENRYAALSRFVWNVIDSGSSDIQAASVTSLHITTLSALHQIQAGRTIMPPLNRSMSTCTASLTSTTATSISSINILFSQLYGMSSRANGKLKLRMLKAQVYTMRWMFSSTLAVS